jgi:hypothetical protein
MAIATRGAIAFSGDKIRPGAFEGPAIRQSASRTARCAACKAKHFAPACSNNAIFSAQRYLARMKRSFLSPFVLRSGRRRHTDSREASEPLTT